MNDWIEPLAYLMAGSGVGAGAAWVWCRTHDAARQSQTVAESAALRERLASRDRVLEELKSAHARVDEQRRAAEQESRRERELRVIYETRFAEAERNWQEKQELFEQAEIRLADAFRALSAESLRANNEQFLDLARVSFARLSEGAQAELAARHQAAEHMIAPIGEALAKVDEKLRLLEAARAEAYHGLKQQVEALNGANQRLAQEASQLGQALRAPAFRGAWGEVQLRRLVELAGMLPHADFEEQPTLQREDGGTIRRPDLIIRLPGGRGIAVDAKAPLTAWLEAQAAADDAARKGRIAELAKRIRAHALALSGRSYDRLLAAGPGFTVLFLPSDALFTAAMEADPELLDYCCQRQIVPASPSTLLALLKAVAHGWEHQRLAEHSTEIAESARELYEGALGMFKRFGELGGILSRAVQAYNGLAAAVGKEVVPAARRLERFRGSGGPSMETPPQIHREIATDAEI